MDDLPSYRCAFSIGEDVVLKILPRFEILTLSHSDILSVTASCLQQIVDKNLNFNELQTQFNLLLNIFFYGKKVAFKKEDMFPTSQIQSLTKLIQFMGGEASEIENADFVIANRAEKYGIEKEISPSYINFMAGSDTYLSFEEFSHPKRFQTPTKSLSQKQPKPVAKRPRTPERHLLSQTKKMHQKKIVPDPKSRTLFDCMLSQTSQSRSSEATKPVQQTVQKSKASSLRTELEKLTDSVNSSQDIKQISSDFHEEEDYHEPPSLESSPVTSQISQLSQFNGFSLMNSSQKKPHSLLHSGMNSQCGFSLFRCDDKQLRLSQTETRSQKMKKRAKANQKMPRSSSKQLTLLDSVPKKSSSTPKIAEMNSVKFNKPANDIEEIEVYAPQKMTGISRQSSDQLTKLCLDLIKLETPIKKSSSIIDSDSIIEFSQRRNILVPDENEKLTLTINEDSVKRSQNDDSDFDDDQSLLKILSSSCI